MQPHRLSLKKMSHLILMLFFDLFHSLIRNTMENVGLIHGDPVL